MTPIALALAERAVPRYTSYPTAPQFGPAVDGRVYEAWLAALPADATISLYVHVPYCAELCLYCGCHTKAVRRDAPLSAYAQRLAQEISLLAARIGRRKVSHLHWGGGTPSVLGEARLVALAALLREAFAFAAIAEHAIEIDPRQATRATIDALGAMGINRVSLGVQDFSAHVQQAIGRVQPYRVVADVVDALRAAGIIDINFDLMYGLPRQREDDVRRTVALAAELRPRRLALFAYAHVPWFRAQQRLIDEADLPGVAERLRQGAAARELLTARGYAAIGLDHFAAPHDSLALAARDGRLHRNFQGYTIDDADALIGIGASAIGRLPQGFVQNAPGVGAYERAIAAGRFATLKGLALTGEDRLRGHVIERIMCDLAVDLAACGAGNGPIDFGEGIAALTPLRDEGLVEINGARIRVTERGRPFVRLVAAAFDRYLANGTSRHSRAV
ncbi:MAG TPA: oxygen-independent coproporphyrinogen III oxidase [Xanthobacteraceae bacterium]|nr:oxygen-independent coproporphyrinogen III oxidase [Xanthobacteraceae bacterium]